MKKIFVILTLTMIAYSVNAQNLDQMGVATKHSDVKFRAYIYAGTGFAKNIVGPTIDINLGIEIEQFVYLGVETGFHSLFSPIENMQFINFYNQRTSSIYVPETFIPIGLNFKAYCLKNRSFIPYVNVSLGGFAGCCTFRGSNGLYAQVGAGFDIKCFSFGIGYMGRRVIDNAICTPNSGYIKIGYRF